MSYYRVECAFNGIQACSSNTVHWVFAMKYWGVAQKLKLLDEKHDPEQFNTKFNIIFWVGFGFNSVAGLLFAGLPYLPVAWFIYFVTSMQSCIFVSCGFLIDAFRILSKKKEENQVISKKLVTLLSIAFGGVGISVFVSFIALVLNDDLVSNTFGFLTPIFIFLSCLILTLILTGLTEMQGSHSAHTSIKQNSNHSSNIQDSEFDLNYNESARPSVLNFYLQRSDIDFSDSEEGPVNKPDFDNLDEQILISVFEKA